VRLHLHLLKVKHANLPIKLRSLQVNYILLRFWPLIDIDIDKILTTCIEIIVVSLAEC